MKYAYRVSHSEDHRSEKQRLDSPAMDPWEVYLAYKNLEAMVLLNYELEPEIHVQVVLLRPKERGAIVLLKGGLTEIEADESIGRCVSRINSLDASLCFIAEPLPGSDSFFHRG